jgi:hypothetical protein
MNDLKELYNFFGSKNFIICGGLCDVIYIGYDNINDIDIIVNKTIIEEKFHIKLPMIHIKDHGFDMKIKRSTKFIEDFYQGKFLNTKIDIFLADDIHSIDREVHILDSDQIGGPVYIDSIQQRLKILNGQLDYIVTEQTSGWEKYWIRIKQEKARKKIKKYELIYYNP